MNKNIVCNYCGSPLSSGDETRGEFFCGTEFGKASVEHDTPEYYNRCDLCYEHEIEALKKTVKELEEKNSKLNNYVGESRKWFTARCDRCVEHVDDVGFCKIRRLLRLSGKRALCDKDEG